MSAISASMSRAKPVTSANLPAMGIVFLAVRSDGHYFQIVALKMLRKGMESLALLQRFRAERQILAK